MALFNKLFSSHKRKTVAPTTTPQATKKFPFSTEQVRILLYRECDFRGKKLLFDSTAVQKVPSISQGGNISSQSEKNSNFIEIANGYRYTRPRDTEHNILGEMIFGSVAMSYRGTAFKVHWLEAPTRLLCSQVFLTPVHSNRFSDHITDTQTSDLSNMDTRSFNSFSMSLSVCVSDNLHSLSDQCNTNPLDVPASEYADTVQSSAYSDSGYSGTDPWTLSSSSFYPYSSTRSSVSSMYSERGDIRRKLSTDSSIPDSGVNSGRSDSNLQRRVLRNISTSFENKLSASDCIGYFDDNVGQTTNGGSEGCVTRTRRCSEQVECRSNPEMIRRRGASGDGILGIHSNYGNRIPRKRAKLGLAICITLSDTVQDEMQLFCSEHISLLESMLCRLRSKAENAYLNKKNFYQIMLNAWFTTIEWITDLFTAPRLEKPVWLTLSNGSYSEPAQLAQNFMGELCWLLTSADTKDTNFFVSTLLTAILTHHLGWVGTVAPLSKCSSLTSATMADTAKEEKAKMSEISRFRPYNPLWAQLGDLYGAIGNPPKISKTIVSGNHRQTIDKVLNVLTYFIRCGEIKRDTKTSQVNKDCIDKAIADQAKIEMENNQSSTSNIPKKPGLIKTATVMKDLSALNKNAGKKSSDDTEYRNILVTFKKNDIPNVLVFRDSRFVQQELRIGNFQMDTGIEMSSEQKFKIRSYKIKGKDDEIKFLITSPDDDDNDKPSGTDKENRDAWSRQKAMSLPPEIGRDNDSPMIVDSNPERPNPLGEIWGNEPMKKIKKGLKIEKWLKGEKSEIDFHYWIKDGPATDKELKRSKSLYTKSSYAKHPEHIRRLEASRSRRQVCTDSKEENAEGIFLKSCPSLSDLITANSVGTSERLTWGIERVKEAVCLEEEQHFEIAKNMIEKNRNSKNSNVVFVLGENEELVGLRQIADPGTNGFGKKSRNYSNDPKYFIPSDTYGYLQEKGFNFGQLHSIDETTSRTKADDDAFGDDCDPNDDDDNDGDNISLKRANSTDDLENAPPKICKKDQIQIVNIPMPIPVANDDEKLKDPFQLEHPGFVPSLFVGITDHYIADVVLQGTVAPQSQWEPTLKQNLALSSHCATIEQTPTENVAIIANTDTWDVKIVSSQTHTMPGGGGLSGSTGMSQLVSAMLETVQAMWNAGISAYQCMSYVESKLRELYLQSEVLATFLLATEFCSLNNVTSALNLSVNDVPLLLSVASIHSPQVTKKYGLSFR